MVIVNWNGVYATYNGVNATRNGVYATAWRCVFREICRVVQGPTRSNQTTLPNPRVALLPGRSNHTTLPNPRVAQGTPRSHQTTLPTLGLPFALEGHPRQCSKLRIYFMRPSGADRLKMCARDFTCALLWYIAMIID